MTLKLSLRASMGVSALVWGGCVFLVGVVNLAFPLYGAAFLHTISSVYPGFHASRTIGDVMIGTVYALVDGGVGGLLIGWLYNTLAGRDSRAAHS